MLEIKRYSPKKCSNAISPLMLEKLALPLAVAALYVGTVLNRKCVSVNVNFTFSAVRCSHSESHMGTKAS